MQQQYPDYQLTPGEALPADSHIPSDKTNVLSIVSLVSSLCTVIVGFGFIVGIVTGHIAMRQINQTGERGRGMAKAGLIIGYIFLGITVLATILFIIMVLAVSGPGVDAAVTRMS